MLGAAGDLQAHGITVDAAIDRAWETGVSVVNQLRAAGTLPPVVVVHLANNGPIEMADFAAMMQAVDGRQVYFVNLHEARPWESEVNTTLADGVARYPNAHLIDWHDAAGANPDWLCTDGIHISCSAAGPAGYATLIANVV
jgi:hypothetical protein